MTTEIDTLHFQELSHQHPKDVCRRALCTYDEADESYHSPLWGDIVRVLPRQRVVTGPHWETAGRHDYFQLFSVHYLLHARAIEWSNEWVSEKDLPGGATFFRGPHAIPTQLIANRFDNATNQFERICRQLQGVPLAMADAAFRFEISPRIPVAVLYWCGDDDFPAESKLLFDRTISAHCALDIIFALAVGICHRLAAAGNVGASRQ